MPAGVSWPRYLRMFGASILAMFAGAQVVHQYYLPDLVRDKINRSFQNLAPITATQPTSMARRVCQSTIPEVPPKPGELQTELRGYKVREEAAATLQRLKTEEKVD